MKRLGEAIDLIVWATLVTAAILWLMSHFCWAGTIPQYPPEDYVSGKAQAEIHERQMQEYEQVLEMQRRQERQGYPADYYREQPPANNYDPRLWKNR